MIHLDTHVIVWLYAGEHDRIPPVLRDRLETEQLAVSPMVRLELAFLREMGRLRSGPGDVLDELERAVGLRVDDSAFTEVVASAAAERMAFTRDPFDRLIAAHAIAAGADLASKDQSLRDHLDFVVWQ